jgi:hypothetical protein
MAMSREFGEWLSGGYFHNKIDSCLEDIEEHARTSIHKELVPLFKSLSVIAHDISSVEAGDSGESRSILRMLDEVPKMIKSLKDLNEKLDVYREIISEAIETKK